VRRLFRLLRHLAFVIQGTENNALVPDTVKPRLDTTDDCNWTLFAYLTGHKNRVLSAYTGAYLCFNKLKYSGEKENLTRSINQLSKILGNTKLRRELGSLT
jgi:hypothetical protein